MAHAAAEDEQRVVSIEDAPAFVTAPPRRRRGFPWKGFFILLSLVFFTLAGIGTVITCVDWYKNVYPHYIPPPAEYAKAFCTTLTQKDYSGYKGTVIYIRLQEGCYHDYFILPTDWKGYRAQLQQRPGNWGTAWCDGHNEPGPIVSSPHTEGVIPTYCRDTNAGQTTDHFSVQGQGLLVLRRTEEMPKYGMPFPFHVPFL